MIVKQLVLRNFRNYGYLDLEFEKGINLITGINGSGKTNIVEAIHFLSLARSFRSDQTSDLIMNTRQFATIEALVELSSSERKIEALLTPSSKKITANGKPIKKISELASLINVTVFVPKDALMFIGAPLIRRNYLDINLSKKSPIYLENLMIYEKLLKERNALLKAEQINLVQLDVVTKQIVDVSKIIVNYRLAYVAQINAVLSKIVNAIAGEDRSAQIVYEPFVDLSNDFVSCATRAYEKNLDSDIKRKMTQIGVHREDFKLLLDGDDISAKGSQGENRLCAIALKLAPYFLIEDKELRPIVVLDDVLSELDNNHQNRLINFLKKFEQVFITSTNKDIKSIAIYEVDNHKITRRNA